VTKIAFHGYLTVLNIPKDINNKENQKQNNHPSKQSS